jgi:tRNA-splicing endonuclease subunit Sen34
MDQASSSTSKAKAVAPAQPVRISRIAGRYLIFDIKDVAYLRRHQNISSIFVGTLPQSPTQNVFLGLPIELYAEEAKLLVERGVAYVVDDAAAHLTRLGNLDADAKRRYVAALRARKDLEYSAMREDASRKLMRSEELKKKALAKAKQRRSTTQPAEQEDDNDAVKASADETDELFALSPTPSKSTSTYRRGANQVIYITPTTSTPLLSPSDELDHTVVQIEVPESYHLYAHLNSRGYYMLPGLRFGGDYNVYPGDPFRYHAHFLALSLGWNEEFPMLDLVARGRLGTSVKKGFLIGGRKPRKIGGIEDDGADGEDDEPGSGVRTFCVEWAAM